MEAAEILLLPHNPYVTAMYTSVMQGFNIYTVEFLHFKTVLSRNNNL